jgi:hypothetical protein
MAEYPKFYGDECLGPDQAGSDPQHNTMLRHPLDIGMSTVDPANLRVQACAELGLSRKLVQPWCMVGGGWGGGWQPYLGWHGWHERIAGPVHYVQRAQRRGLSTEDHLRLCIVAADLRGSVEAPPPRRLHHGRQRWQQPWQWRHRN